MPTIIILAYCEQLAEIDMQTAAELAREMDAENAAQLAADFNQ